MKKIKVTAILMLLLAVGIFNTAAFGFQLKDRSFFKQNLIILFDVSQDVVSCLPLLKKNLRVVKDVLSEDSLKRGHIGKVLFLTFRRGIVSEAVVDFPSKGRTNWKKVSRKSFLTFKSLFEGSYDPHTEELADILGAIERAVNYAKGLDNRSIILVVSPGVQQYNRRTIYEKVRLQLPEKVRKLIFLSQPFVCQNASEALKYQGFSDNVLNYWKTVIVNGKTLEFHYSY